MASSPKPEAMPSTPSLNTWICASRFWKSSDEEEENELFQAFDSLRENGQFTVNCNQGWQGDVEWALEDGLSRYIGGDDLSVHDITSQMQEQLQKNET